MRLTISSALCFFLLPFAAPQATIIISDSSIASLIYLSLSLSVLLSFGVKSVVFIVRHFKFVFHGRRFGLLEYYLNVLLWFQVNIVFANLFWL